MVTPNLIVSISGLPKSGKTHLAFTFPDPIRVFSFDRGYKEVRAKFPNKQIDCAEYDLPIVDSLELRDTGFPEIWKRIRDDIREAISGGVYKTIVIDTASSLWEIIRYAFNESENRAIGTGGKARNYGEPNARMSSIFARAQLAGINLVLIQYLKDRWVSDENTGEKELDGWRRTEGLADVVLEIRQGTQLIKGKTKNANITLIKGNRYDRDLNGQELTDATYQDLLAVLGVG